MSSDDAALVARVLDGDREALAAVYDRYADRLHDFAYSMLRSSADAQDAVADSFVLVTERLSQLRDPDRLRPWLYAIVRSECLRRFRSRDKIAFGGDEAMADLADTSATPEEAAETEALKALVWDAAAGLADRDRALLDLNLRQGLEGAELAEAMGVSTDNSYVMLSRVRGQMERSLGALLVAKTGRDDCSDLDGVLGDWDGSYSPLIRKRVARHVDGCEGCTRRKAAMVAPAALFAGVAAFAAPSGLRERVLNDPRLFAGSSGGFPWLRSLVGAAAVLILVLAGVVFAPGHIGEELLDANDLVATPTPTPPATSQSPTPTPTRPTATTLVPSTPPTVAPEPEPNTPPSVGSVKVSGTCEAYRVEALVTDDEGVAKVTLTWSGGVVPMTRSGDTWVTTVGPIRTGETVKVTATDTDGATSTASTQLNPCPQ